MDIYASGDGRDWPNGLDLVLEEARRSIDGQRSDLNALRQRAGALVGLSGIAASLSGTLGSGTSPGLLSAAGVAFLWVVGLCLSILRPREFTFELDAAGLYENFKAANTGTQLIHSTFMDLSDYRRINTRVMARLNELYLAATIMLGVEVLLLVVAAVVG
jgi:hypothetical protein